MMSGYVAEYTRAIDTLQNQTEGHDYDVREWLSDWMRSVRNTPGNENLTHHQIFQEAVRKTSLEIKDALEESAQRQDPYERQWGKEYDRQMREVRQEGYEFGRAFAKDAPEFYASLSHLRADAENGRSSVREFAGEEFNEHDPKQSLLSQDDYIDAYKRGGNKAIQEWYFEQKDELQLGRTFQQSEPERSVARLQNTTVELFHGPIAQALETRAIASNNNHDKQQNREFWQLPGASQAASEPANARSEQHKQQQNRDGFGFSF